MEQGCGQESGQRQSPALTTAPGSAHSSPLGSVSLPQPASVAAVVKLSTLPFLPQMEI